ncbi:hypothetical protein GC088_06350 [Arthrobacter sp. JZ12]|nr:hypothetical protein GC088_06350 [Arthrobacter sp. JZ12]
MQQSVHAAALAVAGNTARALRQPAVQHPERERRRTPLSLVPAPPTRGRVPFAVFSMAALVAALVVVLMLNISVSSRQYELVSMRGEEAALSEENEALAQQLEDLRAPQNLAAAAHELDMVTSPTFGTIDVDSKTVTGSPEPAKESDAPQAFVPAPAVSLPSPLPPVSEPVADSPEPAVSAPAVEEVPAVSAASESAPAEKPAEGGGSIPAPQQATPGQ